MISSEILAKYNMKPIDGYKEDFGDSVDTECMFYKTLLMQTDHIPLKIFEGSLTSANCVEELEAREYARMKLAELNGKEYTGKRTKTVEERTTETENVVVGLFDTETTPQAAAEMRLAVQMFAQNVTEDDKALKIKSVYPKWNDVIGEEVTEGFKFRYGNNLFKVIQPKLTIESHRVPGQGNESLYAKIDETHAGTVEDPIPYGGNMEIFSGKYYIQNEVIYECIRDSGTPLYHSLADLVGVYVKVYATE